MTILDTKISKSPNGKSPSPLMKRNIANKVKQQDMGTIDIGTVQDGGLDEKRHASDHEYAETDEIDKNEDEDEEEEEEGDASSRRLNTSSHVLEYSMDTASSALDLSDLPDGATNENKDHLEHSGKLEMHSTPSLVYSFTSVKNFNYASVRLQ